MATTIPLVLFALATTGLGIITLIGFVFTDWHAQRGEYEASLYGASQPAKRSLPQPTAVPGTRVDPIAEARNETLKAA